MTLGKTPHDYLKYQKFHDYETYESKFFKDKLNDLDPMTQKLVHLEKQQQEEASQMSLIAQIKKIDERKREADERIKEE